jgi:flagellar basal-body rod modification protein FlgD
MQMSVAAANNQDWFINPNKISSNSVIQGKDSSQLTMDDFFNLLVAQLTNQDMLNPQADTEFISQMAQFTTLQGINTIQEYQLSAYAVSYVGKHVSIAHLNEAGNLINTEGVVTSVTFYDGQPKVIVDGKPYPLFSVMEVNVPGSAKAGETAGEKRLDEASEDLMAHAEATFLGREVTVRLPVDEYGHREHYTGVVDNLEWSGNDEITVIIDGIRFPANDIVAINGRAYFG